MSHVRFLAMFKNIEANLAELTEALSLVLPAHAESFLALVSLKNLERRKLIIKVAGGRQVKVCVNHSTVCGARSAAASLWKGLESTPCSACMEGCARHHSGHGTIRYLIVPCSGDCGGIDVGLARRPTRATFSLSELSIDAIVSSGFTRLLW